MKKIATNYIFLLAFALACAACADKENKAPSPEKGISIEVALPADAGLSRSVPTAPAGHALRCVLEAWTRDGSTLKARTEQLATGTDPLTIKFDLEDSGEYTAVLWADYIDEEAAAADATLGDITFRHYPDKYYRTTDTGKGLRQASVVTPYANTHDTPDARDAFTGRLAFTKGSTAVTDLKVTLARPLSRLTIAEKDAANVDFCATVTATYKVPAAIDAFTGELVAGQQAEAELSGTPGNTTVTVGGAACRVLFSDLVLAPDNGSMGEIALSFVPVEANDKLLPAVTIPAGVPLKRGYRVNAAGKIVDPTDPFSRVILAVDIADTWTGDENASTHFQIPDANFRQFCIDQGYADAEGYMILEEAAKVTEMDVFNKNIASLEGIGYFTGLTRLDCSNNSLASLDLSGCTKLTELLCHYNSLESLDVAGCPALSYLSCSYNSLESLNVAGCSALSYLSCDNNSLESLDVAGCSALNTLSCYNNSLESLDVSMTLKTTDYTLYCGNQKNELTLILDDAQKSRWNKTFANHSDNNNVILQQ